MLRLDKGDWFSCVREEWRFFFCWPFFFVLPSCSSATVYVQWSVWRNQINLSIRWQRFLLFPSAMLNELMKDSINEWLKLKKQIWTFQEIREVNKRRGFTALTMCRDWETTTCGQCGLFWWLNQLYAVTLAPFHVLLFKSLGTFLIDDKNSNVGIFSKNAAHTSFWGN